LRPVLGYIALCRRRATREANLREVDERFHQIHEQTYTFRLEMPVEIVNFHLTAIGQVAKPQVQPIAEAARSLDSALKGRRMVNFDELGYHESPVYERDWLPPGAELRGPLVVEEPASTTVVFPDQRLQVDRYGFLYVEPA